MLTITILSIAVITGAAWLAGGVLPFKVCPICAGVSGTWLWMLVLSFLGYEIDLVVVAMLMGGSVIGIAYQLEKKLPAGKSALLWKVLFIPVGFVVAYSAITLQWGMAAGSAGLAGALSYLFLRSPGKNEQGGKVEELKQKMENCC